MSNSAYIPTGVLTASYAVTAAFSLNGGGGASVSSSWASSSLSSSYATTASYALNGGSGGATVSWKKLVAPMFVPVTTSSPIFTNSASQTTLIKSIYLYNTTATSSNCQIYNVPNVGGTLGSATGSNRLFNLDVPAYSTVQIGFGYGITLSSSGSGNANDAIFASTATTSSLTIAMFGDKPTTNTHLRLKDVGYMTNITSSIIVNPTGLSTDVRLLVFHNTDSTTQTVYFYDVPNSASLVSSASAVNQLASIVLPPNDTFIWDLSDDVIKLDGTNDAIQVNSTTTNKVVVCGYGAQA